MEFLCDSDDETDMGDESEPEPDTELDETQVFQDRQLNYEPEPDAPITNEYAVYKTPIEQLQDQQYQDQLAKLHVEIKAQAQTPTEPAYQKLYRTWPPRPLAIQDLPDQVQDPIHYFELLWTQEAWSSLVANTNSYAEYRIRLHKEKHPDQKGRWWTPVNLYEMRIFIALLLYMSYNSITSVNAYWSSNITVHKPMEFMSNIRFLQILRYLHVSDISEESKVSKTWYGKVWPLYHILRKQFKAYVVLGQNVSFDEMMVPYTGRSSHTLKMKNKPIAEGFKIWALCWHGFTIGFLWYSRLKGKTKYLPTVLDFWVCFHNFGIQGAPW